MNKAGYSVCDSVFESHTSLIHHPEDGGSTHHSNVGILKRDYTALHARRLSSSKDTPVSKQSKHFTPYQGRWKRPHFASELWPAKSGEGKIMLK